MQRLIQEVEQVTELEKSIKILMEHTQHFVPTEDLEHLYSVIETAEKVSKYENAEEEGRLVVLPCKVGDAVYLLFVADVIEKKIIYEIFKAKVTKITIDRFRAIFSFETLDKDKYKAEQTQEAFGKTVFLTRGEAEKALKEMKGKHE